MKKLKKLWIGLALLLATFSVLFLTASPAAAACQFVACSEADITKADKSYVFEGQGRITATFDSQKVTFVDNNTSDDTHEYLAPSDPRAFCSGGKGVGSIDISGWDETATSMNARVDIDYLDGSCRNWDKNGHTISIRNPAKAASQGYQWNNDTIISDNARKVYGVLSSDKKLYGLSSEKCGGGGVIVLNTPGGTQGTEYKLSPDEGEVFSGKLKDAHNDALLRNYYDSGKCYLKSNPVSVNIAGTPGRPSSNSNLPPGGTTSGNSSDCFVNNSSGLEWLLCPITTTLSKAVDEMNGFIEGQLNFNVDRNLNDDSEIHTAWALFKNIVTALVIIVMLVMVISQAINQGPFEAYTVKKALPRLVVAVILMQISWDLGKWLITLANDVGLGIKELMLAPFGTGGDLDLNSILSRLDSSWAGVSQVLLPTLLVGGVIVTAVALPGAMVMAFGLFIGVFMALAMLLFRNVLIVSLMIFAPLAFLIWVFPSNGAQRMWKFWTGNFSKLLMFFPLLIAIIYSGRIFAWIVADQGGGSGNTAGFIDYLMVLVAYFGPYFVIFKAYKWGGGLLNMAGTAASRGRRGLMQANTPWLRKVGERVQGNLADRYRIGSEQERRIRSRVERLKAEGQDASLSEAALAAARRKNKFRNALLRIGAGQPLPTERSQIETLFKAGEYKKDLTDKKGALIMSDYVEELDRSGGDVQAAKAYILRKWGSMAWKTRPDGGILLDKEGKPVVADKYTERAMQNFFPDTNSAMELGNEAWRQGGMERDGGPLKPEAFLPGGAFAHLNPTGSPKKAKLMAKRSQIRSYWSDPTLTEEDIMLGKKPRFDMAKTSGFMDMMNSDKQRYSYVAERLPYLQPFNQELGGGPKRQDYRPSVVDTDPAGNPVVLQAPGREASNVAPVRVADYMVGGDNAYENPTNDPVVARQLANEEAQRRSVLLADDARLVKWQRNMESPSQLAAVRPELYQDMAALKTSLEEVGLNSRSAEILEDTLRKLSESKGPEGASILQRLLGGEKSAVSSINDMLGPGWLEGKLGVEIKSPVIQQAGGKTVSRGGVVSLPRETELVSESARRAFKAELLDDVTRETRLRKGVAQEVAQALSEMSGYSQAAHGTDQSVYRQLLEEVGDSVGTARKSVQGYNALIDDIIERIASRVERAARSAEAQGKTPDEVRLIAEQARDAANAEIAIYNAMKKAVPPEADDPTIVTIPHPPPGP
ncbi:hypothetical protein HY380_00275 [Candidatus Saccharibacteria bacterium]|nr:hypothetical protein [Candidatus Saccharibacteria bacterium]